MKLSMETYILHNMLGEEKALETVKAAGFDSVDYSFYWSKDEDIVLGDESYINHAKNTRAMLDNLGLTCNQAHAPFDFSYGQDMDICVPEYKKIVNSIEAAAIMGAEHIIVHSIQVPFNVDVIDYNTKFYKSLEPYCKQAGIKIAIENLFWYDEKSHCCRGRIHTPELLYKILQNLNSDSFVICIDLGHAAVVGIEPDEMIKALDNKVLMALHVHDNNYANDQHLFPYHGSFDWDKIMSALKKINYQGDLTLEVFGQLSGYEADFFPDAVAYAQKIGAKLIQKFNNM